MYYGGINRMMIDTEEIKDGAVTAAKANDDFTKTVAQTLTEAQKAQARDNIDVDSSQQVADRVALAVNTIDEELEVIGNRIDGIEDDVEAVEAKIPAQASSANQLADKNFVNSSVQTATANFRGDWATKAAIPTDEDDYPEDYSGSKTPTTNDYLVVLADESEDGGTWRYKYVGLWSRDGVSGWEAEYRINEKPLTAAQLAALNSNITAEKVAKIDDIDEAVRFTPQALTTAQKAQARDNIGAVNTEMLVKATHSQLKTMRDAGTLIAGTQYRITDYTCTTVQADTQSAGHAFDIIVTADDESTLNENARAIQHDGDTYFANSNLAAWRLKYTIDNDTAKFAWADTTNGKGVVYWMQDEADNECPYDFKNIMFKGNGKAGTLTTKYYYTFSVATGTDDAAITDHSLDDYYCYENTMEGYWLSNKQKLNANIFRNTSATQKCNSNTLGQSCYVNTFGQNCNGNTFGQNCQYNTFGQNCNRNVFGRVSIYNQLGDNTSYVTAGSYVQYCGFGDDPTGAVRHTGYIERITIDAGTTYATIHGGTSSSNLVKNAHVLGGYYGGVISFELNKDYSQMAGVNSSGAIKVWKPADLIS